MYTDDMLVLVMVVSAFSLFSCLGTSLFFAGQAIGRATLPASMHLKWAWRLSVVSLFIPYVWPVSIGILVWRRYKKWEFLEDTADADLQRWARITLIWVAIHYAVFLSYILSWLLLPRG